MSSAAITGGGAAAQMASVMSAAALQGQQLGMAEAQIDASDAAGGNAPSIDPGTIAPGAMEVFA